MILFYNVDYFKSACTKAFTGNIYRAKKVSFSFIDRLVQIICIIELKEFCRSMFCLLALLLRLFTGL